MSAPANLETVMELLRLRRRYQHVAERREQLRERVAHYPNPVNSRQLATLVAELRMVELQIAELESV